MHPPTAIRPPAREPMLRCRDLRVDVPGRTLVDGLSLGLRPGELLAVLGRNGVGKTLTLHTLAGLRPAAAGSVTWQGRPLEALGRRALARRVALLMQSYEDPFPSSVLEAALIGRHPHIDFWRWESAADRAIARAALAAVDLAGTEQRAVGTLSGGERRRLAIAAVLTQDPQVYLLDEPTNHLDPHHQLAVLEQFRARADAGCSVVVSLHDANLAVRYADCCLLLFGDGRWQCGPTRESLDSDSLSRLYATAMRSIDCDGRPVFVPA